MNAINQSQGRKLRLNIVTYPSRALEQPSKPVEEITDQIIELACSMVDLMQLENGLGLAAPQVGISRRLIIVDAQGDEDDESGDPVIMINPEIISTHGTVTDEEGCLSFPGIFFDLPRPKLLGLSYTDIDGNRVDRQFEGLAARCAIHEVEHLDGVLFWDYLSPVRRAAIRLRLLG